MVPLEGEEHLLLNQGILTSAQQYALSMIMQIPGALEGRWFAPYDIDYTVNRPQCMCTILEQKNYLASRINFIGTSFEYRLRLDHEINGKAKI